MVLRNYRSWGSLANVFDESDTTFSSERKELQSLLSKVEYQAARATVLTAYYTPPVVTQSLWSALDAAGFEKGRVLEPGCGVGNFMASASEGAHMVGVERDPSSALIANALYPQHLVHQASFENVSYQDNSFTAAIGNVPFSQSSPHDPVRNRNSLSLHNYFISKSIDLVAPGGYVAVVTSQHSADSPGRTGSAQVALTDRADFVTGVRLPGGRKGVFSEYAGTEVGTDVLIFRVREEGAEPSLATEQFRKHEFVEFNGTKERINSFFASNPDHVLGEYRQTNTQYGLKLRVQATDDIDTIGQKLEALLTSDIAAASAAGYPLTAGEDGLTHNPELDTSGLISKTADDISNVVGSLRYSAKDGEIAFEQLSITDPATRATQWQPVKPPAKRFAHEWTQLIDLRNTTQALMSACADQEESKIHALQNVLHEQYDSYTAEFGAINRFTLRPPRAKSQAQIDAAYAKLSEDWRRDNAINDRPYEGPLPDEVHAELLERAADNGEAKHESKHLSGAIAQDPYMVGVRALEDFDKDTQTAKKSGLFYGNPLREVPEITSVDTTEDAIVVARNQGLPMTANTFSDLTGLSVRTVEDELTDKAIAFRDPQDPDTWIPASTYLSGRVKQKLNTATELAETDSRFTANVTALEENQPPRIEKNIDIKLGAPWVPDEIYVDFIADTLRIPENYRDELSLTRAHDKYIIDFPEYWPERQQVQNELGIQAANAHGPFNFEDKRYARFSHHGVAHNSSDSTVFTAEKAMTAAMNISKVSLRMSKALKEHLGHSETAQVTHQKASEAAAQKVNGLRERFERWVIEDPERYNRLVDSYNEVFNIIKTVEYDGSQRPMPGLGARFKPYHYQLNAVERMVNEPSTLLNHVVGAGKTGSMIMGAMELKRLGLAKQPWMVVPAHLVDQIGREAKQWYPTSKVLVGSEEGSANQVKEARQTVLAQSATSDWDLVIVSDNAFKQAAPSPEVIREYTERYLAEIAEYRERALRLEGKQAKELVRKLEMTIENTQAKLATKLAKAQQSKSIYFDHTGCDYLIVDEAHNYKNLQRDSDCQDLSAEGSQKATDMDMKIQHLRSRKDNPHAPTVTFATGTPIANNIAELWVMMRYLSPDLLEEAQISGINAWGSSFTGQEARLTISAGGSVREQQKINTYENLHTLVTLASPFLDTVTQDQITAKLPKMIGGKPQIVKFEVSQETKDFLADMQWRENHLPDNAQIDNPLKIINDGKLATLDPRMANLPPEPGVGRVATAADRILTVWKENKDNEYLDLHHNPSPTKGALQIVFCDKGVPTGNKPFNVYDALRDELVAKGMSRDRIRFIHEWDHSRTTLFDDCNNGKVDVLIGNTQKLSTGANIQSRAVAVHHLDVPWRPADIEQQRGRAIRQGNQNEEVGIYLYIAEGTYDAFSWSIVDAKQRFITQFFNAKFENDGTIVPLEGDGSDSMAHAKAVATGNQDYVLVIELESKVNKIERERDEHFAKISSLGHLKKELSNELPRLERRLNAIEQYRFSTEQWAGKKTEDSTWSFGGKPYTVRTDARDAMFEELKKVAMDRPLDAIEIGSIGGLPIRAQYYRQEDAVLLTTPAGRIAKAVQRDVILPNYFAGSAIQRAEHEKNLPSTRGGFLSRLEGIVRDLPENYAKLSKEYADKKAKFEEINNLPPAQGFERQEELDAARAELETVKARIQAFDNSDAQKRIREERIQRMRMRGQSPGYTLELNPTKFMIEEKMTHHPDSHPIEAQDGVIFDDPLDGLANGLVEDAYPNGWNLQSSSSDMTDGNVIDHRDDNITFGIDNDSGSGGNTAEA